MLDVTPIAAFGLEPELDVADQLAAANNIAVPPSLLHRALHAYAHDVGLAFRFEDRRQVGDRAFPYRVRVEQPGGAWLEVAYRSLELNVPVDESVFSLPVPAGDVRLVDLDAVAPR